MTTLIVRLSTIADAKARFVAAGERALAGEVVDAVPSVNFSSYDDMHRVLAPSRLAIVKALAGRGALSIREVARRVDRDVQAVSSGYYHAYQCWCYRPYRERGRVPP